MGSTCVASDVSISGEEVWCSEGTEPKPERRGERVYNRKCRGCATWGGFGDVVGV